MTQPPAAWFPDPVQPGQLRYWDGAQWTPHVAPRPVAPVPGAAQMPASQTPASQAPSSQAPTSHAPSSQAPTSQAPTSLAPTSLPPTKRGGLPVWAIVLICVVPFLVIAAILAAIAIPVYLNQQQKGADAAAQASVQNLALAIADYSVNYPGEELLVTAPPGGSIVQLSTPDGTVIGATQLEDGVSLGGFTTYNNGNWCVWVTGEADPWHWSSAGGLDIGQCP